MNTKTTTTKKKTSATKTAPLTATFEVKVRHDGAINLRKKGNAALGIRRGSTVIVSVCDGKATLTPKGYVCSICGQPTTSALDINGICKECNSLVVTAIKSKGYKTVAEAIAYAQDVRSATVKSK